MSPDLSRRLARALDVGLASIADRDRIVEAARTVRVRTFADLPDAVQRLVRRLES